MTHKKISDKTELVELLTAGVDPIKRKIYFGVPVDIDSSGHSDFSMASVEVAVRALHRLAAADATRPIEIHMGSYGGDPYAMMRLHDEILACPCQVKFFGGGAIMSAATWIMAACDERYLHKHTTVMLHDGSTSFEGKHTDFQIYAKEEKRLQELLNDIYAANSRMPGSFWKDICQRDAYLTAEEAVLFGLADKVIEPKRRGSLRKMRQACLSSAIKKSSLQKAVKAVYSRIERVGVKDIEIRLPEQEPVDESLVVTAETLPVALEKQAAQQVATEGEEIKS